MNIASGFLAFLVMTAYWPGFSGAATVPRFTAMACASILVLIGPRIALTTAHVAGLLFLAWCAASIGWSDLPDDAIGALFRLLLLTAAFALGSQLGSLRPVMIGAVAGLAISSALAIAQWYGWRGLPQGVMPAGLFYNKNYMAEVAALVLIWALAERMWLAVPALLPAVVLPMADTVVKKLSCSLIGENFCSIESIKVFLGA